MTQSEVSIPIITPVEEKLKISWHKELSKFFKAVGLNETSQSLDTEILVLSHYHQAQLPEALETLVGQLLITLEQHVDAKENIIENVTTTKEIVTTDNNNSNNITNKIEGLLCVNNKKRKFEDKNNNDNMDDNDDDKDKNKDTENRDRAKGMDPNQVQIRASNAEVQQRINTYIQTKQQDIDTSNRAEFLNRLDPKGEDITCARADAREINRNIQMKFDIVNNEDGPIARSLVSNTSQSSTNINNVDNNNNNNNNVDNINNSNNSNIKIPHIAVDERLKNIEAHLNIQFEKTSNEPFTCMERIKILEDTIMEIERKYPKWAAIHFNQPNRTFPPPPPVTYISRTILPSSSSPPSLVNKSDIS